MINTNVRRSHSGLQKVLIQQFHNYILSVGYFQKHILAKAAKIQNLKYIFILIGSSYIPAAVLRHKTARNTTAGMRSISTNSKFGMIFLLVLDSLFYGLP